MDAGVQQMIIPALTLCISPKTAVVESRRWKTTRQNHIVIIAGSGMQKVLVF
jgi:ABC-type antimicrobial peptide transport system permease subunit